MTLALMWEARAAAGQASELLAWARAQQLDPAPLRRETFTAPGDRVLVITWWPTDETAGTPRPPDQRAKAPELPEPEAHLIARPVHRWHFVSLGTD